MTARAFKDKLFDKTALIQACLTFILGAGLNSIISNITYANKVEFLTQKVAEMNVTIDGLVSKKLDAQDIRINNDGNRITALETVVFRKPEKAGEGK